MMHPIRAEDAEAFERLSLKQGIAIDRLDAEELELLRRVFVLDVLARKRGRIVQTPLCNDFLQEVAPWLDVTADCFLHEVAMPLQQRIHDAAQSQESYEEAFTRFWQAVETRRAERIEQSRLKREQLQAKNQAMHADTETEAERLDDIRWMRLALQEAKAAGARGEVPVGAVLVAEGAMLAKAGNEVVASHDPCGHAEIRALTQACRLLRTERLPSPTLYVTLEPCPMCTAALANARVRRIVWAASDRQCGACGGAIRLTDLVDLHHRFLCRSGVLEHESERLLMEFFASCRKQKHTNR